MESCWWTRGSTTTGDELYDTRTGGESWAMRQASIDPIPFPGGNPEPSPSGWRLSDGCKTRSYIIEHSDGERWQTVASFLVDAGACKP